METHPGACKVLTALAVYLIILLLTSANALVSRQLEKYT